MAGQFWLTLVVMLLAAALAVWLGPSTGVSPCRVSTINHACQ
jgi:hypothetical protein